MKRRLYLLMIFILSTCTCYGCGNAHTDTTINASSAAKTESPESNEDINNASSKSAASSSPYAGVANPFTYIDDDHIIEQKLNISIDTSKLPTVSNMSICNDEFCQIVFTSTDIEGETVEWMLRATKNAASAPMLHGMHYENLSEPVVIPVAEPDTEATFVEVESEPIGIYTWCIEDTYYSLTSKGGMLSQMEIAEILDSVFAAIYPSK